MRTITASTSRLAAMAAAILVLGAPSPANAGYLFSKGQVAAGNLPICVVTADLNGDGQLDLISANTLSNALIVSLGANLGYTQSPLVPTGAGPRAIATGDWNRDGIVDLATANGGDGTITVLQGNGNGTFTTLPSLTAGSIPGSITSADLNGDGRLDLMAVNQNSNNMSVFLGNGDGTFGPAATYATPTLPLFVAAGDFNEDHVPDVVTANGGASVSVFIGTGSGSFSPRADYPLASTARCVAVADFNSDGHQDLAVSRSLASGGGFISILLGRGDGTFSAGGDFPTGALPRIVATGDLNGDGRLDLVTANQTASTASILLGNGDGTFRASADLPTSPTPRWVTIAELSGDGRADLVVSAEGDNSVFVYLGNGDGTFGGVTLPTGSEPFGCAVADLNLDGRADVAVIEAGDNTASVFLGTTGAARFGPRHSFGLKPGYVPQAIAIGDLNSDRKPDLAVPVGAGKFSYVSILYGNGKGNFGSRTDIKVDPGAVAIAIADFNGDGVNDFVTANSGSGNVSVVIGRPNGTFLTPRGYTTGPDCESVAAGDINGDGKMDLVAKSFNTSPPHLWVLIGNGDGTFGPATGYTTTYEGNVAVGDLNLDGRLDVMCGESAFLGVGGGALAPALASGGFAGRLADFDGDERLDAVAPSLAYYPGKGDGTFSGPLVTNVNVHGPWFDILALGDLDGDGRPDIAGTSDSDNTVTILFDRGAPPITVSSSQATAPVVQTRLASGTAEARVFPNPLNPRATLTFRTSRPGVISVHTFDLNGRLVRNLLEEQSAAAGEHSVMIDGRNGRGQALASGIYFYVIETPDGTTRGRFTLMK